jgi:hypothetical protein
VSRGLRAVMLSLKIEEVADGKEQAPGRQVRATPKRAVVVWFEVPAVKMSYLRLSDNSRHCWPGGMTASCSPVHGAWLYIGRRFIGGERQMNRGISPFQRA